MNKKGEICIGMADINTKRFSLSILDNIFLYQFDTTSAKSSIYKGFKHYQNYLKLLKRVNLSS